jgi:hypothetical protein
METEQLIAEIGRWIQGVKDKETVDLKSEIVNNLGPLLELVVTEQGIRLDETEGILVSLIDEGFAPETVGKLIGVLQICAMLAELVTKGEGATDDAKKVAAQLALAIPEAIKLVEEGAQEPESDEEPEDNKEVAA